MTIRFNRKSAAWFIRIRNYSARAFVFGLLGMALVLLPLMLTSGSVWAFWYF